ncbi:chromosome partitioning protein ParB [Photobacterium sp. ZSDE20]|uniref:Chromosome partitioning protein ParB n=1 Tax=Photobacterium pectinilyticum TaxID=2906793 RepID=A0ABT1N345_9GAMM|nr:ParB family protein [Photobacterium sp. ZSDE20]MCQ1059161.1 chromosome partitioning protein ParB [Photobacterium sp. ZSDE20]MDD1829904.1 chromosome partitioning protein ParB [Photobacterium sp. ZSDE20]
MAKKKQVMGMTDNQPGAEEASRRLAEEKLSALPDQLKNDLELTGTDLTTYLNQAFGLDSVSKEVEWTLGSGRQVKFIEANLSYEQVKNETVVEFEINGRDQDFLNSENLSDLSTMDYQQFYPAIACRKDGKVNFLDGSRRRGYFLAKEGAIENFTVLIAEEEIESSDAKALAKSLQSAREHNLYEIGKRCELYKESGLNTQAAIAEAMGISRPKVVRALQAASVGKDIYQLFSDINELTVKDYAELSKLNEQLSLRDDRDDLIAGIDSGDVDVVISSLRELVKNPKPKAPRAEVTQLVKFDDKNKHARKRVKGRDFSYEFSRLTVEQQKHLDKVIDQAMSDLFS